MPYPIRVRASAMIIQDEAVLLVEFNEPTIGIHYNLPAGGVEAGESIIQAVKREAREEAAVHVEVGPLAFVYEYAPHLHDCKYGPTHVLDMIFECRLAGTTPPRMPDRPDPDQTGVKWVPLAELESVWLLPEITPQIIAYTKKQRNGSIFIEAA